MPKGAEATQFELDWQRGRYDTVFWAKRFLNVELHPGQVRFVKAIEDRSDGYWRAKYLTLFLSAGNRAGKTLALAVVYLHSMFYKMGIEIPAKASAAELRRWSTAQYHVYHFGITQEVADLAWQEIDRLISGTHEAQHPRACPLVDETSPSIVQTKQKYQGVWRWVRIAEEFGGAELHFRTTAETATSTLGRDMALIGFDEAAFEPHLDFVLNQVLHMRRMSTGGQLILVSTPTDGLTAFSDLWATGDPDNPLRQETRLSLRMSTRDNIGYGLSQDVFDRLVADMPEYLVPQNIDGYFIEGRNSYFNSRAVNDAFVDDLPQLTVGVPNHAYVQGVDAALTQDSTWSIVIDVTDPDHMVGVRIAKLTGRQHTEAIVALGADAHRAYTDPKHGVACATAVDATGFGGKMFLDLLRAYIEPVHRVEFGGRSATKMALLGRLKVAIESGRFKMPRSGLWLQVRRQLLGYRLSDRKIEQDAVMALAVALTVQQRVAGGASVTVPFHAFDPAAQEGVAISENWSFTKDDLLPERGYFERRG